ncbi:MAG: hypothetical protein JRJ17_08025, partial [Deltaproteobacteria bacterium]|nr:hypothetical protein [Deltaproteobacteria bacterium]
MADIPKGDIPESWKKKPPPAWKLAPPEEIVKSVDDKQYTLGLEKGWMSELPVEIKPGMHCYAA